MAKLKENPEKLWLTRCVDSVEDVPDAAALTMADLRVRNTTAATLTSRDYTNGEKGVNKKVRHGFACAIGNVERSVWAALAEPVVVRAVGESGIQAAAERIRKDTNISAALRRDDAYVRVEALRLCCEESN